eukprot:91014-Prymnesium_polylepis.1
MQGLLMPPAMAPPAAVDVNGFSRWTTPNGHPRRGGGRLAPPYMVKASNGGEGPRAPISPPCRRRRRRRRRVWQAEWLENRMQRRLCGQPTRS